MGSFNPINLIFNTAVSVSALNNANQTQNSTARTLENFNTGQNIQTGGNSSTQSNSTPLNYTNITQNGLSNVNQNIISTVEIEQRANYIKDLLNLPRDFETFINQIQSGTNPVFKDLNKLLINGKIDINSLTLLLADNSKEAVQKLMETIVSVSKMGSNNVSELKKLMGLFSSATSSIEPAQTMKNILMLYLPYLPLSIRHELNLDFNIDIFDKIDGPDPDKENKTETIKIMIQTANYGNILATLELALNNEIDILIEAGENFSEKEVLDEFKKENKKLNTRTNISIEKNDSKLVNDSQNIQIIASNFVSPKLVFAAHSLIKIIINVDSSNFIINEEED